VNETQLLNAIRAAIKHSPGTIAPGE
jgi:hypothetical protein